MSEYSFILLITSFIAFIIGVILVSIFRAIAFKKTTKKLGYGPLPFSRLALPYFSRGRNFYWPREYYASIIPGALPPWGPLKPEYKDKVDAWIKEFNNNKKGNPYLILGWLLVIVGAIVGLLIYPLRIL